MCLRYNVLGKFVHRFMMYCPGPNPRSTTDKEENRPLPKVNLCSICLHNWFTCIYSDGLVPSWRQEILKSLAPWRLEWNFKLAVFKLILVTDGWGIFCETTLRWMSLDLTDDKSTLVQVMAWCRQATSHYLIQCWFRSLTPYGVTRPQWVNQTYGTSMIRSADWRLCISKIFPYLIKWIMFISVSYPLVTVVTGASSMWGSHRMTFNEWHITR